MTRWVWDPEKARTNKRDHRISFDLAEQVFLDPRAQTRLDPYGVEERWQSIGRPLSNDVTLLFVVHTDPRTQFDGEDEGRIISARLATSHERKAYEKGQF